MNYSCHAESYPVALQLPWASMGDFSHHFCRAEPWTAIRWGVFLIHLFKEFPKPFSPFLDRKQMWAHLIFKHFNLVLFIALIVIWRISSSSLISRFPCTLHNQKVLILQAAHLSYILKLIEFSAASIKLILSIQDLESFVAVSVDINMKLRAMVCGGV